MKFIKNFETNAQYEAYIATDYPKPNVSYCADENGVYYNPTVPTPTETALVIKYNVLDDSEQTKLYNYEEIEIEGEEAEWVTGVDMFDKVDIDGTEVSVTSLDDAQGMYQLNVGEHTVKYTLKDPTSIGHSAFYDCSSLTSINIPSGVTIIDYSAFVNCSSLTNITIPDSVISIGAFAFDGTPWWNSYSADTDNHYGNIIYINDVAYKATATSITSVTFKENTVSIGGNAFSGCTGIAVIVIPSSVTRIDYGAFQYCSSLLDIKIPSSVTSIGSYAFYNCYHFYGITVQATTPPALGSYVFNNTNDCPIGVPSGFVEVYKAASGWSTYANRIEEIE